LIPNIELPSRNQKSKNASAEISETRSKTSTDLTADEVYALYLGPDAPLAKDIHAPDLKRNDPIKEEYATVKRSKLKALDFIDGIESDKFKTFSPHDDIAHPIRIPPQFPPRFAQGNHSGWCRVRFDVSPEGQTYNIETLICTSDLLEEPTIKSVQKWKYAPKVILLPLPEGY